MKKILLLLALVLTAFNLSSIVIPQRPFDFISTTIPNESTKNVPTDTLVFFQGGRCETCRLFNLREPIEDSVQIAATKGNFDGLGYLQPDVPLEVGETYFVVSGNKSLTDEDISFFIIGRFEVKVDNLPEESPPNFTYEEFLPSKNPEGTLGCLAANKIPAKVRYTTTTERESFQLYFAYEPQAEPIEHIDELSASLTETAAYPNTDSVSEVSLTISDPGDDLDVQFAAIRLNGEILNQADVETVVFEDPEGGCATSDVSADWFILSISMLLYARRNRRQ